MLEKTLQFNELQRKYFRDKERKSLRFSQQFPVVAGVDTCSCNNFNELQVSNNFKQLERLRAKNEPRIIESMGLPATTAIVNPKDMALCRSLISAGYEDDQIAEETGWDYEKIRAVRGVLYSVEERSVVGRRAEEVYVDYVARSRAHLRQLQELLDTLKGSNQGSAAVGAVKAKQDILDRIIARGQEMGFIDKRPERKEVVLARLDDRALIERLGVELAALRTLATRYGETPFIDVVAADADESASDVRGLDPPRYPVEGRLASVPGGRPPVSKSEFVPLDAPGANRRRDSEEKSALEPRRRKVYPKAC